MRRYLIPSSRLASAACHRPQVLVQAVAAGRPGAFTPLLRRPAGAGLVSTPEGVCLIGARSRRCLASGATSEEKEKSEAGSGDKATSSGTTAEEEAAEARTAAEEEAAKARAAGEEEADQAKAAAEGSEEAAEAEPEETPVQRLERELEELTEKSKAQKHNLLLALADFENNKKRFTRERETRRNAATANFASSMVEVYNDFDQSLAAPEGGVAESCTALHEGVVLTRNLYRSTLLNYGLQEIVAEPGQPFETARHENIGSVENADLPADSVAEIVQEGWVLELGKGSQPQVLSKARVKVVRH